MMSITSRAKHQTKIICSLDNDSLSLQLAKDLAKRDDIAAVRLLYDPKKTQQILRFIPLLKAERPSHLAPLAVMIDVGSLPRATVAKFSVGSELIYNQTLTLSPIDGSGDIEISTDSWDSLFSLEAPVFFGFGSIELAVEDLSDKLLKVRVMKGGGLSLGQAIHVPKTRKAPSIFDLSYIDIKPFQDLGIDYVVLPGVRTAREISVVRKKLASGENKAPWLLVRIDHADLRQKSGELLSEADGMFLSRRDLALTLDPATVPMVCKELIRECNEKSKLAIIASEIFASLQFNPTPTRAEVSDIANSVIDGTDGIVLSEEIALGDYTDRAMTLCSQIVVDVEEQADVEINWNKSELAISSEFDTVAYHAYKTAQRVRAKAIVCITKTGNTALRLASFRTRVPIIAVTFCERVRRQLSLVRGVSTLVLDIAPNLDEVLPVVNDELRTESWLNTGDLIVFVTVSLSPIATDASNLFTIQKIAE